MAGLVINQETCMHCGLCIQQCPFKALEEINGQIEVNANCKMCRICVRGCPAEAVSVQEAVRTQIDKSQYHDILVFVEHQQGDVHPVTYELIGKARELAGVIGQQVNCLMIGHQITEAAKALLPYGVANVYVYDDEQLDYFKVDSYANVFEDCIRMSNPVAVLVGATTTGRSLAPRTAVRFRTGLTADCTILEMRPNTDLVQIRPAFGGNIMAQILTTNHRPQFATVRYKVMDPAPAGEPFGQIVNCPIDKQRLISQITIQSLAKKPKETSIADAEVLVVAGAGLKGPQALAAANRLAELLGGMVAITRPLVENGSGSVQQQIGLSGRTVKPKLILTFGISGAIQFTAGMNNSELIVAVNTDPQAPIFEIAHMAVISDAMETLQAMINELERGRQA